MDNILYSSNTSDWITPPQIVQLVCKVFGELEGIDLDPCADVNKSIPAKQHYIPPTSNGLTEPWWGRVYMNPPYGKDIINWVCKLKDEYENEERIYEAIALVPARVDTQWWQVLSNYPVCFIKGRLRFSGHNNSAPFPSAVIYLGGNVQKFIEIFFVVGTVYIPMEYY